MRVKALLLLVLVIAFVSSCEVVTEPDLSVPQVVFEDEFADFWPSLSPDETILAFSSDRDGEYPDDEYDICLYNLETKAITQLTVNTPQTNYTKDNEPIWSVNGQLIYFIRDLAEWQNQEMQLCSVPINGTEDDVEVLQSHIKHVDVKPSGDKLAVYHRDYDAGTEYLAEYDLASGTVTPIESSRDIYIYALKYLPDGSGIMASINPDDSTEFESHIVVFPVNGDAPYEFIDISGIRRISFSPNGEYCLLSSYGDVQRVPIGGGEATTLTPDYTKRDGVWASDGYVYFVLDKHQDDNDKRIWQFKP